MSVNRIIGYAGRVGRICLHSTFGTGMDEFMTSMNKSIFSKRPANTPWYKPYKGAEWDNLGTKLKNGFKAVEAHEEALRKAHGNSWFKSFWHQIKTTPSTIGAERKAGIAAAKLAGKSTFWGGFKGFGTGLMKRMPLIGGLMAVGFQLPNLIEAFTHKDGGLGTGLVETGKAAAKLGLDTAGFMVGQALIPIPFVGGMIGAFVASTIGEAILGKSFSEKQAEKNGESHISGNMPYIAQNTSGNGGTSGMNNGLLINLPQPTMTDEQIAKIAQQLNYMG